MAVTTRGSDGTAGPSGSPSTTSSWAKASGRSTRRHAITRQLSAARKNGWAKRPDAGSSSDGSTTSAPSDAESSTSRSATGRGYKASAPAGDGEIDDLAHDLR